MYLRFMLLSIYQTVNGRHFYKSIRLCVCFYSFNRYPERSVGLSVCLPIGESEFDPETLLHERLSFRNKYAKHTCIYYYRHCACNMLFSNLKKQNFSAYRSTPCKLNGHHANKTQCQRYTQCVEEVVSLVSNKMMTFSIATRE